ncbi:hypothetical protein PTKIN_Ptkin09bG0266900 [Pterospermum kingtungense]
MAQNCSVEVLEDSHVSPAPGSVPTTSIPLTFLDTLWLSCCPMQRLFFYEFPHPTFHFIQNTLPNLRHSLSLTLQHFFPFAGKIKLPPPPQRPYILFTEGDYIPFLVAESEADFNHLIGNQARHAQELQALVPKLPPPSTNSVGTNGLEQYLSVSLMAIQVTIFPKAGISIGITFFHAAADGSAFADFTKSWASVCRSQWDLAFLNNSPPDYSRDSIQDPQAIWSIFLEQSGKLTADLFSSSIPTDVMRVTYGISKTSIETLKKWITTKCRVEENEESSLRLSTFAVTCGYIWVCLIKLQKSETPDILLNEGDVICHFIFHADCRDRINLPTNYFGNCLQPCLVAAKRSELLGEYGVAAAAKAIGRAVAELDKGVLKEAEKWISRVRDVLINSKHVVSVAGSPNLRVYEKDFGWGRPRKSEVAHIGCYGSISIAENRDEELGGVEFGLALATNELDKFNAIFEKGLVNLL